MWREDDASVGGLVIVRGPLHMSKSVLGDLFRSNVFGGILELMCLVGF